VPPPRLQPREPLSLARVRLPRALIRGDGGGKREPFLLSLSTLLEDEKCHLFFHANSRALFCRRLGREHDDDEDDDEVGQSNFRSARARKLLFNTHKPTFFPGDFKGAASEGERESEAPFSCLLESPYLAFFIPTD